MWNPTPLTELLATRLETHSVEVHEWLARNRSAAEAPFYSSVDIRDSGFKVACVDCNLYPGGFNNIAPEDRPAASRTIQDYLKHVERIESLKIRKILLLPENHTQNPFYSENLACLMDLIKDAGYEVELGWYQPELAPEARGQEVHLTTASGRELVGEPISINVRGELHTRHGVPDLVLLNNDFSSGYPKSLDCVEQLILPVYTLGWHTRKKSEHFVHYNALMRELAQILQVDPWCLTVETHEVRGIEFQSGTGTTELATQTETLLQSTRDAYQQHGIERPAFAFIKSNAGTYGMGIMVVRDSESLRTLNRREKNKMSVIKNQLKVESVVVQEGIPTLIQSGAQTAEPVLYLVGTEVIGAFLRQHSERNDEDNLNSRGMSFVPVSLAGLDADQQRVFSIYRLLAQVAALAAARERQDHPYTIASQQVKFPTNLKDTKPVGMTAR